MLLLGVLTISLARQVRRLTREVDILRGERPTGAPPPTSTPSIAAAQRRPSESRAPHDGDVIRPVPLGEGEVEPDLSVSRVASVTLAAPLIKVAAFTYGVRRALGEESRMRAAYAFRKELRRQRRLRRRRPTVGPPQKEGWRP